MPEFPESIKPQVNQSNRSEQQNRTNRFEQNILPPQLMDEIIAGLNYESLLIQREEVYNKLVLLQTGSENVETVLRLQVFLKKIDAKIQRFEDINQIKSTSFDADNIAKFEEFLKDGKPMVARDVEGQDYLVIHGNIKRDMDGNLAHFVDTEYDEQFDTFAYIANQLEHKKIVPNNDVLWVASCHFGEVSHQEFDKNAKWIKGEFGVDIKRVSDKVGKVEVAVSMTPRERLDQLKGVSAGNNVSFQAV